MSLNQCTTDSETPPKKSNLEQVARCLLDYLNVHGKNSQIYQVLRFLAENTLSRLAEGKDARFNYYNIREGVIRETEGDASAWFSPVSYTHLDVYKRQIEGRLVFLGHNDRFQRPKEMFFEMNKRYSGQAIDQSGPDWDVHSIERAHNEVNSTCPIVHDPLVFVEHDIWE